MEYPTNRIDSNYLKGYPKSEREWYASHPQWRGSMCCCACVCVLACEDLSLWVRKNKKNIFKEKPLSHKLKHGIFVILFYVASHHSHAIMVN